MKKALLCIAVAGLASGALAEEFSLSIVGPTTVEQGSVFTIEITGDSTFGTHLWYGAFSMYSNSSLIENITWTPASWEDSNEDGGYGGNGNYNPVVVSQLVTQAPGFDTPGEGSELGGVIGSFQIELSSSGVGGIDFSLAPGLDGTIGAINFPNWLDILQDADGILTLNGLSVNVVPSPSAAVILSLGGLVAGRRRRV